VQIGDNTETDVEEIGWEVSGSHGSEMIAFWDRAPCSLVEVDRRLRGAYCLQRDYTVLYPRWLSS
jgi:hypothetical protein